MKEKIVPCFKIKPSRPEALKSYLRCVDPPIQPITCFNQATLRRDGMIPSGAVVRLFQLAEARQAREGLPVINKILSWAHAL